MNLLYFLLNNIIFFGLLFPQAEKNADRIYLKYRSESHFLEHREITIIIRNNGELDFIEMVNDEKTRKKIKIHTEDIKKLIEKVENNYFFDLNKNLSNNNCSDASMQQLFIKYKNKRLKVKGYCITNKNFNEIITLIYSFI